MVSGRREDAEVTEKAGGESLGFKIEGAVVTDAGKRRRGNEDNYCLFGHYKHDTNVDSKTERRTAAAGRLLAAVYDGMGGEEAGEVASLAAAKSFCPCALENVREEAVRQVADVNGIICAEMQKRGGGRMGTTAVLLYMDGRKAVCCNVGDSRCYLIRNGALKLLSVDHSEGENMIRMGIMSEEQARKSKSWHKLTQHLGIFPEEFMLEPHFSEEIRLQEGDSFLLCSDGLTDMVMDDVLAKLAGGSQEAGEAAQRLVEEALKNGGRDNVTALVLRVKKTEGGILERIIERLKRVPKKAWIVLFILAAAAVIIA